MMIFKKKQLSGSIGKVYQFLFDEIVYNRMRQGTALSETEIAATLNISRTPVREALTILESEGLVNRYPSRGCFVAPITTRDLEEIFELRIQLEKCAIRNSCGRVTEKELDILEQKFLALEPDEEHAKYYEADRNFHRLVLSHCGNSRLVGFLDILAAQFERVRVISATKPKRLVESCREHLDLVHAVRKRDVALAEKLLVIHLANVRDSAIEASKYMNMAYV